MVIHRFGAGVLSALVLLLGVSLGAWLFAAPPAGALSNAQQFISGGNRLPANETRYTSLGLGTQYEVNFPGPSQGELAAQVRMVSNAVLSRLFVRLQTGITPSAGSFTFTVRVNGTDTLLTCTLTRSGQCTSGAATVNVSNGDRVSIVVTNDFVGPTEMAYTYSLLLD